MELNWIEHKGKKILLMDFTGIKMEKEMVAHMNGAIPIYDSLPKGSKVLNFIDLTGCFATSGFMDAVRKLEKEVVSHYEVKRAIMGITGPKEILLKGFNLFASQTIVPFHNRMDTLDYLADDKK